jgi:hypothetical protein
MDPKIVQQILDELFPSLEALDTQSAALLRLVKDKKLASDEEIASYFEQAGNASSVRWRAARARINYLVSTPANAAEPEAEKKPVKAAEPESETPASASDKPNSEANPALEKDKKDRKDKSDAPSDEKAVPNASTSTSAEAAGKDAA